MSIPSIRLLAIAVLGLLLAALAGPQRVIAQPPPASGKSVPQAGQPAGPPVQATLPAEIAERLGKATATLSDVAKSLRNLAETEGNLSDLRAKVEGALDSSSATADSLRPRLELIRSQIDKLGPAPAKDAAPEAPEIAAERSRLAALAAVYDGAIKTSELTLVRARRMIERITELRHALFTKNLMERLPSPLTPAAWREITSSVASSQHKLMAGAEEWWSRARDKEATLGLLLAAAAGLYVLLRLALWPATRRRNRRTEPPLPTFFERAVSAFRVAALRVLPAVVSCLILYIGLDALDLIDGSALGELFPWALRGLLIFAAITALVRAVLAPAEPQWRLVDLADRPARRLTRLFAAMAAVYALDGVLTEVCRTFYVPLALSVAQSIVASLLFAALMMGVALTALTPKDAPAAAYSRHRPRWLKLPLWIVALGIVAAALAGYAALARFASQQVLLTGIVALLCWLGYLAIRAFTREPTQRSRALSDVLERRFGLDQPRRQQLAWLTEVALTFALALIALPFLMLQWGFSAADIRDWSKSLLFGIDIGQFHISLFRILAGIVIFIALLFATRLIQRWMRDQAASSRIDPSIANSMETVVGYAGIGLAALIALSYAGLDITNLAIVAGALSLGIGFGLQSIVNNFVSGLILLIERPIKVGDRVVIGDKEGYVRRISVRATEVETFDKASVIVPNSELIMGRVINWSHRDWRGAASVKIKVATGYDTEEVSAILKRCAEEHSLVLPEPAPSVALEEIGDGSLTFALRISLGDIDKAYSVQSDLRIAILKALHDAGICMPTNHLDVTLRDLETMRRRLDEAIERPVKREPAGAK